MSENRKNAHIEQASSSVGDATRKPPLGRRFQPGQSGNPLGRPVGAHNRARIAQSVMAELREVGTGASKRKLPTLNLILIRLRQHALSGKRDAVRLYHRYLET